MEVTEVAMQKEEKTKRKRVVVLYPPGGSQTYIKVLVTSTKLAHYTGERLFSRGAGADDCARREGLSMEGRILLAHVFNIPTAERVIVGSYSVSFTSPRDVPPEELGRQLLCAVMLALDETEFTVSWMSEHDRETSRTLFELPPYPWARMALMSSGD